MTAKEGEKRRKEGEKRTKVFKPLGPTYQLGNLIVHPVKTSGTVILGIQLGDDGRIWLCVNGKAWIRFAPSLDQSGMKEHMEKLLSE